MDTVKERRPPRGAATSRRKTPQIHLQKRIKKEEQMSLEAELVITNMDGRGYIKHVYNEV